MLTNAPAVQREDFRLKPVAEFLGWIVKYDHKDFRFNRLDINDPARVPLFPLGFIKGDTHLWRTDVKTNTWTAAELINGNFVGHRRHIGLDGALRSEAARQN